MNIDDAVKKAQKLLRLSESDNPNEAASALAQAQAIMDKYEINKAMIEEEGEEEEPPDEDIYKFTDSPLDSATKFNLDTWRRRLADVLAVNNMCRIYFQTIGNNKNIILVGRPTNVDKVRYLFEYFAKETERLCKRDGKGRGRTWRNNYRHGVIDTLETAIEKEREKIIAELTTGENSKALVKVNNALEKIKGKGKEVEKWMDKNLKLRTESWPSVNYNAQARLKGQRAGHEIKHTKARGALKS